MVTYSEKTNKSKKSPYFKEIDGLRALAIILVIINHFNNDLIPSGYLGVDIFFVISGFVITSSLYQRKSKNFKEFIIEFYVRRFKRLVPALLIFVLCISIIICLFNPFPSVALKTGLSSLFGISNIYLLKQSTDYFSQSTQLNVFTHTWSLGVEEQFYLLFPFLVWFSGYGRQTKNGSRNIFLSVGALTLSSFIGFIYLYPRNQSAAYFLMPTRFWELAAGCLLFLAFQKRTSINNFFKDKLPPLFILILIIGLMWVPNSLGLISTTIVVFLTCLLIISMKKQTFTYKIFTYPLVIYIGRLSYSLYLWHWAILSLSRWTIGINWWTVPLQLFLIIGLAIASFKWIELPMRDMIWFKSPRKVLISSSGALVLVSLIIVSLGRPLKGKLYSGDLNNKWNIEGFGETKIINDQTRPTIYLIGDSHAGHYGAVMTSLARKYDYSFIMHPQGGGLKSINESAEEHVLAPMRKYKNKFKVGDIIIFSSSIDKYKDSLDFTKTYQTFMKQTNKKGLKYFLISPTPTFSKVKKGDTCQEEWFRPSWSISPSCFTKVNKNEWLSSNSETSFLIKNFLIKNSTVSYIDTFSLLCPDDYCNNHDENSFMYKDAHHLTSYGAMKMKKMIETNIIQ